jgi:diacylglycerol kinase family enzyme
LRTVLILNPKAGQGRHLAESRGVLKLLRSHRWDATLVEASTGHELAQAVRNAVMAGVELVVAAGGDGTISTVASMLAGGTAALGVIPSGTLNHFARDLGIPLSIPRAAEVLLQANIRRITTPVSAYIPVSYAIARLAGALAGAA